MNRNLHKGHHTHLYFKDVNQLLIYTRVDSTDELMSAKSYDVLFFNSWRPSKPCIQVKRKLNESPFYLQATACLHDELDPQSELRVG